MTDDDHLKIGADTAPLQSKTPPTLNSQPSTLIHSSLRVILRHLRIEFHQVDKYITPESSRVRLMEE